MAKPKILVKVVGEYGNQPGQPLHEKRDKPGIPDEYNCDVLRYRGTIEFPDFPSIKTILFSTPNQETMSGNVQAGLCYADVFRIHQDRYAMDVAREVIENTVRLNISRPRYLLVPSNKVIDLSDDPNQDTFIPDRKFMGNVRGYLTDPCFIHHVFKDKQRYLRDILTDL